MKTSNRGGIRCALRRINAFRQIISKKTNGEPKKSAKQGRTNMSTKTTNYRKKRLTRK